MIDHQLLKALEEETAKATEKMVTIATTPCEDDLDFAKRFIDAQYQVILCLINEKLSLLAAIKILTENVQSDGNDIPLGNKPTLH